MKNFNIGYKFNCIFKKKRCMFGDKNELGLCFCAGKAKLYWKGIEITKSIGLHTAFDIEGKWHDSTCAYWQFKKISPERLYINISYKQIPITQEWLLVFTGENEISWEVEMKVKQPLRIAHNKTGIFVSDKYNRWFNSNEEGEFPQGFNWENISLSRKDSRSFGVKPQGGYPGILFEVATQGRPLIQNTNEALSARTVQFELTQAEEGKNYQPGNYKCCFGKIKVIDDEGIIDEYISNFKEKLGAAKNFGNEKLKFFFDNGKVSLRWKGLEITKNLGLHTAFNVENQWYDSSCADWQFNRINSEQLQLDLQYRDIPISQSWLITFNGVNEFSWENEINLKQPLSIQYNKAGIFISDKYIQWFNSDEQGEFPQGFNWENVFLNRKDSRSFGVKPFGEYPGISFEVDGRGFPLLQNTNEEIKGRAVQFELDGLGEGILYQPGKYKCYSAKVKLIEDVAVIDDYIASFKLLPLENEPIYIYGDAESLHDKTAGIIGNFKERLLKIKQALEKDSKLILKVGVSRFNFFKIKEIVEFSSFLSGRKIHLDVMPLCMFPVQKLYFNFVNYLEEIKSGIKASGIQLVSVDEELFDLLSTVSSKANIYNERKLLRLLGVVSEHAFIGPQTVVIDPYHRCNVNCLHCWVHTPSIKHTQEFLDRRLDFNLYKQMIDDFSELKVDSIIFQGDGEPLLYDKFFDMFRYARNKNIEASFFTNGLLLNKDIANDAVKLGASQIFCSLPAGTDKTYALVTERKETGALNKVLENLAYLTSVKRLENKIYPKLIMTHVIHTLNYKEIVEMARNDVEIGADVIRFYLIRLDDNIKFLQLKPEEIESIKESMSKVKVYLRDKHVELLDTTDFQLNHYEKETGAWSKGVFLNEGCLLGWFFCLIPALGDISLCCHLRTVGYLKEKTFKEIWNSKEYQRYRVQAKYLKDNKDVTFLNGVKLYDEHCEHCDTHQVIRDIRDDLKNYNLERFL